MCVRDGYPPKPLIHCVPVEKHPQSGARTKTVIERTEYAHQAYRLLGVYRQCVLLLYYLHSIYFYG